jgi:hypothetical protein
MKVVRRAVGGKCERIGGLRFLLLGKDRRDDDV